MKRRANTVNQFIKNFRIHGRPVFKNIHTIAHEMVTDENNAYFGRPEPALLSSISSYLSGHRVPSSETQKILVVSITQAVKSYLEKNKFWEQDQSACEKFIQELGQKITTATNNTNPGMASKISQILAKQPRNSMLENCIASIQQAEKLVCINIPILPHVLKEQNEISAELLGEIAAKIAVCKGTGNGLVEFHFGRNFRAEQQPLMWATLYSLIGEEIISLKRLEAEADILAKKAEAELKEYCSFAFTSTVSYATIKIPGVEEYYLPNGKYGRITNIVRR